MERIGRRRCNERDSARSHAVGAGWSRGSLCRTRCRRRPGLCFESILSGRNQVLELLRFCDPWSTRSPVGGKGGQESFRETRGPLSPGHGGESRLRSLGPTSQAPHTELLETQRGGQSVSRTRGRRLGSAAASRSRGKRPGCSVSGALTENLAPVSVCRYPNIPPPHDGRVSRERKG